jgi:N-acetyl-beta-hexosaminidase
VNPDRSNFLGEPIVVLAFPKKRDKIEAAIAGYERKIREAQADLAHITASLRLFELSGDPSEFPADIDLKRILRRGKTTWLCMAALNAEDPLDTRQLTQRVMAAKRLMRRSAQNDHCHWDKRNRQPFQRDDAIQYRSGDWPRRDASEPSPETDADQSGTDGLGYGGWHRPPGGEYTGRAVGHAHLLGELHAFGALRALCARH